VEEVIRHPQYKPPAKYNDIALLKLDHPVEFNESIRPACLHTTDTFPINKTVATGWGRIEYGKRTHCSVMGVASEEPREYNNLMGKHQNVII
jgi:hypothetical protein